MATLLLEGPPKDREPRAVGTLTLVLVLSPVRAPDGTWHTTRQEVAAGQSIAQTLPARHEWGHVIWNGGSVPAERWPDVIVQPGDELWAFPSWGYGIPESILIGIAVSLVVSIAITALTYLIFPPQKTQIDRPDEQTFSFTGIRTTLGPGNPVPIIYGRHRVGGQLLTASVDQQLNVSGSTAGISYVTAQAQPPMLSLLLALGEGPVEEVLTNTVEINGQPYQNFLAAFTPVNIETRLGTPDQTPIFGFGEIRNTHADGRDLPDDSGGAGAQLIYTTTEAIQGFNLNIVFNQGLFHVNGKGEKEDNSVNISYRWRKQGDADFGPWIQFLVSAQRTAPVRFGIKQRDLDLYIYEVAVNFGGVRHDDDLRSKWQPTLESVTEVLQRTETYPNTVLLGLSTLPSEALQGSLPNVTVEVKGRTVRVGSTDTETWTDNPAWCVMDFLTSTRYGLAIPFGQIDLASFSQWSVYNDQDIQGERRHTLNYVLDRDARAQQILMEMMGGSRTVLLKSEGLWIARPTRNDPPVQLLSWANCTNLKITYTRDPDRTNVMEGRFANEEDGFEQDVITWPLYQDWPAEIHKASLEIRGVTKPSRIMRALQFELNRRRFENVKLEMDCSLDALVLQVHDIFRFSHPLPAWGASGRIMEGSDTVNLFLDEPVGMVSGTNYHIYVKHTTDAVEIRPVINTGLAQTQHLQLATALQFAPIPRDSLWAFGTSDPDTAVRLFRVTSIKRNSDTTCHLEAVVFNPSVVDEATATALPIPPGLFNPLGPPPPILSLIATELTRVQPSGTSLRVVNLSWDVGALTAGYAPYNGAMIYRRTVLDNAAAGQATAGETDHAAVQNDSDQNFIQLHQVVGHVLEWDDYGVVTGSTYVYLVVPYSQRGVPNNDGARQVRITVAGPTGPDYYPGTVPNLRLRGKAVGDTVWEGRDVHVQWDQPTGDIFNETFFIIGYAVNIYAPHQEYLMRSTFVTAREFTYTLEQNIEDEIRNGHIGARRDMEVWVWAWTNTNRLSLDPAHIAIVNPAPDMSVIQPETKSLVGGAQISWDQFVEPRDFDHYELHLDDVNPPTEIYEDIAIGFHGYGVNKRKVSALGLTIGTTYYSFVLPYDTFGPGIASQTVTVVPRGTDPTDLDPIPPGPPTALLLTTGSDVSNDGTIIPWVRASWTAPPDDDVAGYQVQVRVGPVTTPDAPPTTYTTGADVTSIRFNVPGGVLIRVKVLAVDNIQNHSPFTAEASILVGGDTVPPAFPTGLFVTGAAQGIHVLWTPPADADYSTTYVWSATENNRNLAAVNGTAFSHYLHTPLPADQHRWYWVQAVDSSGNLSGFFPADPLQGIEGVVGKIDYTYIESILADSIIAGTIKAYIGLDVGGKIFLDGRNSLLSVYDDNLHTRAVLGKLGGLATDYGLDLYAGDGARMWHFSTGATRDGLTDGAVNAAKIEVGSIKAYNLIATEAVITGTAQIADAVITDAKITDLVATKITAGSINAQVFVGFSNTGGNLILNGPTRQILILDEEGRYRVWLGRTGLGIQDYGLMVFDNTGQVMWDLHGASELGIQDLAVTNAKIRDASITSAKIGNLQVQSAHIENLTVGTQKIAPNAVTTSILFSGVGDTNSIGSFTEWGSVIFPELAVGDVVWLVATCTALGAGAGGVVTEMRIQEDNLTGPTIARGRSALPVASASEGYSTIVAQSARAITTPMTSKKYLVATTGTGTISDIQLVAVRFQK